MIVQPDYLTVRPILEMSSGSLAILAAIRRASRHRHTVHPVHNVHKASCSRIYL
jgi:hypothetical protein